MARNHSPEPENPSPKGLFVLDHRFRPNWQTDSKGKRHSGEHHQVEELFAQRGPAAGDQPRGRRPASLDAVQQGEAQRRVHQVRI